MPIILLTILICYSLLHLRYYFNPSTQQQNRTLWNTGLIVSPFITCTANFQPIE
ncbi:methylenetetrahydrofolate reductase (NAD(P)H) [Prevotella pallens ATCC 700821]|uniref:Methylenetetrahydrofolate reductase (NAD(P)H) n=1 Tax=Prevotella pallens ATCC 700821 TaxID=997353 RepID=F9DFJ5_9BACT|nr:methylenetetrahydrofolate reductase (NAD(P)H) [Prevotella pallens ATCC 700821]